MYKSIFADAIQAYLETHEPTYEATGWVPLEPLFAELTAAGHSPAQNKYDLPGMVRDLRDSRFETGYGQARLRREEPWPVEGINESDVPYLLALLRCHESGLLEATSTQIAERSGCKEATAYQKMQKLCFSGVKRTGCRTYRLDLALDQAIWIRPGGMGRGGRLTTLAKEKARLTTSPLSVPNLQFDTGLALQLLAAVEAQLAYHRESINVLEPQRARLKAIVEAG